MRKNVKVVGIGPRKMGTSAKTGRSYDFTPVAIVFPDDGFSGFRAATVNMDSVDVMHHNVQKDVEIDMVFHFYNGNITVDAIL